MMIKTVNRNNNVQILNYLESLDKKRDAIAVFWYGKYCSVYYRRHSIFRGAGLYGGGVRKVPSSPCTFFQERINQQKITALVKAPMPLAFCCKQKLVQQKYFISEKYI